MRLSAFAAAASLALTAWASPLAAQDGPQVAVPGGVVEGAATGDSYVFRGIPFAASPLGDLRWRAPQPVVDWEGVRDATQTAAPCPQYSEGWNQQQADSWSEDCLTLDIRTPSLDGARPVMVWIHGGSNRSGGSGGPADSDLTRQGVVVVGIQYRLGVLGFMAHPELTAEQGGASGNYGLMDQIAALRWVRDNIHLFGGDPAQVTIFGESAGSQDVSLMLSAPAAQGLFDAAILQSGTPGFGQDFRTLAQAEAAGAMLGSVAELRAMPVQQIVDLTQRYETDSGTAITPFLTTVIDGRVLPAAPDVLLAAREPLPVIIGTDRVEFTAPDNAAEPTVRQFHGANAEALLAIYANETVDPRRGGVGTRALSDALFHCPADRLADLLVSHDWPVWRYEFDIGENGGLTRHAYEIGWVFERLPVGSEAFMQDYWAALAVSGDPNGVTGIGSPRPFWEPWRVDAARQLLIAQDRTEMEEGRPRAAVCALQENL